MTSFCNEINCNRIAKYSYYYEISGRYCALHKKSNMIIITNYKSFNIKKSKSNCIIN